MLKMPQQEYIRFLRETEGLSINEIAQQMGIHWRTAKKYADQTNWNDSLKNRKSSSPVMGPFMDIVDTWLTEDRLLPRKQRHTGVRIFQRLRDEYQFTGGQRTVLAYVSKRKSELELERAKTYERLEHPPGEAQVDFTTLEVSEWHRLLTYKLLVVSLPYSNAAFVYPTPDQKTKIEGAGQGLKVPQGLTQAQFDKVSSMIRGKVGHISDDIVVQGSRAKGTAKTASDIDIAIRVPSEKFDELIQSSFSKVKPPNPGSAKEKTMLHAIET